MLIPAMEGGPCRLRSHIQEGWGGIAGARGDTVSQGVHGIPPEVCGLGDVLLRGMNAILAHFNLFIDSVINIRSEHS